MSNDNPNGGPPNDRRGSVASAAFSNLFHRSNSTSAGSVPRESMTSTMARDSRRRLSVTTLGLSGTSPSAPAPFGLRRGSVSTTNSESIDENAVEDEDSARLPPTSPFARRVSFGAQAMRNIRTGQSSPGSGRPAQPPPPRRVSSTTARPPPSGTPSSASTLSRRMSTSQASNTLPARTPSDMLSARSDNGYNWTEQLRSRAESSVAGQRPSFAAPSSSSPPRASAPHDRAKSVSEMPAPPRQPEIMKPKQPERQKPDHMQERILKGDFYMD